ncbi:uncharacterized protein LOC126427073 [Schistocerca serialis cubense]|uniref:uncharacterized protein LOC126427073 n=1 Tax=Schistocerca serialis cubense TaxID=2023355 RepID=UPI00214F508D|nr:uncharacterized protein LOC126427073 [Schistocerca serialis cubense]
MPANPAHNLFFDASFDVGYAGRSSSLLPPGVRFRQLLHSLSFRFPKTFLTTWGTAPPWHRPRIDLLRDLCEFPKDGTPTLVYRRAFAALCAQMTEATFIYTDGSKTSLGVGSAYIVGDTPNHFRLPDQCSVYTAELYAVLQAVHYIRRHQRIQYVICSDSLSSLLSLQALYPVHPLVHRIQDCLRLLHLGGVSVAFLWLPGHAGICGNEAADIAAKAAVSLPRPALQSLPFTDLRSGLCRQVTHLWHAHWSTLPHNKLREVKAVPCAWTSSSRTRRREEVILARLRIGHCLFSHRHLLSGDPPPLCPHCSQLWTVRHLLIECPYFNPLRSRLQLSPDLSSILADDTRSADRVLQFIRDSEMTSVI